MCSSGLLRPTENACLIVGKPWDTTRPRMTPGCEPAWMPRFGRGQVCLLCNTRLQRGDVNGNSTSASCLAACREIVTVNRVVVIKEDRPHSSIAQSNPRGRVIDCNIYCS
jgi:hypothetical protein